MNRTAMYRWIMAASLTVVVAVTLILCLMNLSAAGMTALWLVNVAAAVTFSICPTLADREDKERRGNRANRQEREIREDREVRLESIERGRQLSVEKPMKAG